MEFTMDFSQFVMTEEQKFVFDLKGYLLIPDVFSTIQVEAMKDQVYQLKHPDKAKGDVPGIPGGATEAVFSNPIVKGVLKELIGPDFRLDSTFLVWRERGMGHNLGPHQGGPMSNPHFHYHFTNGKIRAGMVRMVIELNPVSKEDGGTVFLPGSHKANFPIPESLREKKEYEPPFESYDASPGSVLFFSENTCHAGPIWKNPNHPRVSLFFSFVNVGMRWHRDSHVSPEVIASLGPEARWYFRDVWAWDNIGGRSSDEPSNRLLINNDGTLTVSP